MRLALVALLSVLASCGAGEEDYRPARHNVVLFVVDTLRSDKVGALGGDGDLTPRLDRFAEEGVAFTRCIANSTWTKPTMASVMTGLHVRDHGVGYARTPLPEKADTLAELLSGNGYRTAAVGWNPHIFGERTGFEQGFDHFQPVGPRSDSPLTRGEHVVEEAVAWLDAETDSDSPFFLYVHLIDPHFPYEPPGATQSLSVELTANGHHWPKLEDALPEEEWDTLRDLYDGEVAYADAQFGAFLDALTERGLDQDTLVVFVSDHGEELFEHGRHGHLTTMFEEIVRVPLLMRIPGLPQRLVGTVSNALIEQIDVRATIVHALGLTRLAAASGVSVLPALYSPDDAPRKHALVESEEGGLGKAVIAGRWKYVRRWTPAETEVLYDLRADPGEQTNVADEQAEVLESMRALLAVELAQVPPGYELRAENATDSLVELTGFVYARTAPPLLVSLEDAELLGEGVADWDGPFDTGVGEVEGAEHHYARFILRIGPGDQDGFVFRPGATDEECFVALFQSGVSLDPAMVLLGPQGTPAKSLPVELSKDLGDRGIMDALPLATSGVRIRLISVLRTVGDRVELSAEDEALMRAIGYLGDE